MAKALSTAQNAVLLELSKSRNSTGGAEHRTVTSLEKLHLIKFLDDRWSLTETGKAITVLIRKVARAQKFEGLIRKYEGLINRGDRKICGHDLMYVAEQIRRVFGAMIDENPEAKAAFLNALSGDASSLARAQ